MISFLFINMYECLLGSSLWQLKQSALSQEYLSLFFVELLTDMWTWESHFMSLKLICSQGKVCNTWHILICSLLIMWNYWISQVLTTSWRTLNYWGLMAHRIIRCLRLLKGMRKIISFYFHLIFLKFATCHWSYLNVCSDISYLLGGKLLRS